MDSIRDRYLPLLTHMMTKIRGQKQVSDRDVYQEGSAELLPFIDPILEDHLLPGSGIEGFQNLEALFQKAKRGESSLLLLEHYSNFDLPAFHFFLRRSGELGQSMAEALVSIAGIKLSESNPVVSAFAQAYTRIVIYPSRSIEILKNHFKDPNKLYREMLRSVSINRAAVKTLAEKKTSGKLVLVFPAGTRYRPWDPDSKRGVREIASYIKGFENFCLVAVNGNILRINPSGEMEDDMLHTDKVVYTVGPVQKSEDLIAHVKNEHHFRDDKKQELVDHLMEDLEMMHVAGEKKRAQ
ncbi:MAG TPA: 1-acyl-sn-glycerol-3-phosphate acyltransferase [Rectinemataceae bacterium]|nr:1-acyl-sn-glycerol-3-phosphate acyltransferase [Rectinemataceae bacterium]